jgi:hypothetical protein
MSNDVVLMTHDPIPSNYCRVPAFKPAAILGYLHVPLIKVRAHTASYVCSNMSGLQG